MALEGNDKRILCAGLCCVDIISVCDHYPLEDTDQRSVDYYWQRGGNASNSSSVLASLGANVEFFGTLVKGREYQFLTTDFQNCGINIENCIVYEEGKYKGPVSTVIVNQQNGSRTIMAALSHLAELQPEDYGRIDICNYRWIHFEGRPTVPSMKAAAARVAMYNATVNSAQRVTLSLEMEKPRRNELLEMMDKVDYVFVSKEFARALGLENKEAAVETLVTRCKPGGTVICAWGEDGAAAKTQSHDIVMSPIFPPKLIVDTLGAGDSFNAATIYALCAGISLGSAITFGCKVAGAKCGMKGNKGLKGLQTLLTDT